MHECICSSCRNLKSNIPDGEENLEYICEFGFPSDDCENCETDSCEFSCSNYVSDEEDNEETETVKCTGCGKELQKVVKDNDDGDVYCFDCYLKK